LFLYIDPLKQGLKLSPLNLRGINGFVFIHRSIKTRIETPNQKKGNCILSRFLYIDPLKQGLKLPQLKLSIISTLLFLYIDPLKQGLKQKTPAEYRK